MAFVRSKVVNGRRYYQLVENRREGGKHRQKVLCHLGKHPSAEAALLDTYRRIKPLRQQRARLTKDLHYHLKEISSLTVSHPDIAEGEIPSMEFAWEKDWQKLDDNLFLAVHTLRFYRVLYEQEEVVRALNRLSRKRTELKRFLQ